VGGGGAYRGERRRRSIPRRAVHGRVAVGASGKKMRVLEAARAGRVMTRAASCRPEEDAGMRNRTTVYGGGRIDRREDLRRERGRATAVLGFGANETSRRSGSGWGVSRGRRGSVCACVVSKGMAEREKGEETGGLGAADRRGGEWTCRPRAGDEVTAAAIGRSNRWELMRVGQRTIGDVYWGGEESADRSRAR